MSYCPSQLFWHPFPPPVAAQVTRSLDISKTGVGLTEAAGPQHTATYTVRLTSQPTGKVWVNLSLEEENVATVSPAVLLFNTRNWSTRQKVTVTAVDDNIQNVWKSRVRSTGINHAASRGGYESARKRVTVAVKDDEINPTFSVADAEVSEGDSGEVDLNFTVTLSPATVTKTRVNFRTADVSATAGEDYTGVDISLDFEPGDSSKTVTIKIKGDETAEINETLTATLYGQARYISDSETEVSDIKLGRAVATGTIIDNDTGGLAFSQKTVIVTEGSGTGRTATYTVALTRQPTSAVTVALSSGDEDAATISPKTLTFTAGNWQSGQTVTVSGVDDNLDNDSYRTTTIAHTAGGGDYGTVSGSVKVIVSDVGSTPRFYIEDADVSEGDSGEVNLTFTVLLSPTHDTNSVVNWTANKEGTDTATPGIDYRINNDLSSLTGTLNVSPGESSQTLTVVVKGDEVDEDNETVTVTLGRTFTFYLNEALQLTYEFKDPPGLGRAAATGTIIDDDTRGLAFSRETVTVTESSGTDRTATYTVALTSQPTSAVTVSLSSGDEDAATISPAKLTFTTANWRSVQTVTVSGVDDDLDSDSDRTTTIAHTASGGDYGTVSGEVAVTLIDDDNRGLVISAEAVVVSEAAGDEHTKTYTVALASQPTAEVRVSLSSGNTDAATVSPATLTFTPNNWKDAQEVTVTGVDDDVDQAGASTYRRTKISHAARGGGYDTISGSVRVIVSDDGSTPRFYIEDAEVSEGDSGDVNLTFTVLLSPTSDRITSVTGRANIQDNSDTATPVIDYRAPAEGDFVQDLLAFQPGESSKTFDIVVNGDKVDEDDETVKVILVNPLAWEFRNEVWQRLENPPGLGRAVATGTIIDDDTRGVALSREKMALTEGGTHETYTLKLLSQPTEEVTINVSGNPSGLVDLQYQSTRSNSAPIAVTFDENDWNRPKTVTVRPTSDDDHEDNSGSIVHAVEGYGDFTAADSISVTVTDTSVPAVLLEPNQVSLKEGETATYTVKLATKPSGTVTVTPKSADTGIATVSGALSLNSTNWKSGLTVTVTGAQDEDGATDTTSVTHTVAGYHDDVTRAGPVSVTVADDDAALVLTRGQNELITKDTAPVFVYEGLPVTPHQKYRVRLAAQPGGTVTVTPVSQDETRVSVSGPLTFDTNNWAIDQIVELTGLLDEDGNNERVKINHTVTGYDAQPVSVNTTVRDWHGHTLVVEPREMRIHEGKTGTYSVKLRTDPKSTVTVTPGVSNESVASVSGALTFNSTNWSIPQNVTVTAKTDEKRGGADATITNEVSGYPGYTKTHPGGWFLLGNDNPDVSTVALTTVDPRPGLRQNGCCVWIGEGASITTQAVRLSTEPLGTVTVSIGSLDESIATVSPATFEFTTENWEVFQNITVTGVEDDIVNEIVGGRVVNESLGERNRRETEIVFTTTGDYADADADFTIIVYDNDTRGLALSRDAVSVTEADGPGHTETYTVALTTKPTAEVTVSLSSADDEAATVSPATLAFSASNWKVGQTVTVTGVRDYFVNDTNRTTEISHTASGGDYGEITGKVAVTVTDDDARGLALSRDAVTVTEAAGAGRTETYTVALTTRPTAEVTVSLSSGDGGVATISPATLTFTASNWKVGQTVTVTGVDDDFENDSDRTTEISHTASGGDYGEITGKVAVTVTDDDTRGLALSPDAVTVTEAAGDEHTTTYTVALTTQPDAEVTVSLSSGNNSTATVSPATLTFTVGNWKSEQTVTVTAVDDKFVNTPERTTTIAHTASGGDYGEITGEVAVTVTDDDTRGFVFSNKYLSVTEAARERTKTYTVALASQPTAEVTVSLSSNHTDIATVSPATLTFTTTNWSVPQTVTVTGVDDEVDQEGNSAYRRTYIPHTARGGDYGTVSDSVRVDVFDDEGTPTLYIEDAEVSEGDSGDEVDLTFTVILNPAEETYVLLSWTVTKESADTATPGVDYKTGERPDNRHLLFEQGGLSFRPGEVSKSVTVKVIGDEIDEANETLTVTLSKNRTQLGVFFKHGSPPLGRAAATGTIIDDDDAPSGAILLSVSPSSVAEADGATAATVTAQLPGTTTRSADTAITVSVGDSADAATEGTDYGTVDDFTLTIPAGESSGTAEFSIDPTQDTIDEGAGETLSISGAINGNVQGLSVTATQMTIADDDDTPTLTLALSESSISENGGASTVTATLSAASNENVTVMVSADAVSPAVNADFTLSQNKTLTIAAGETSSTGTVIITGVDNSVDAPDKTVTVSGAASGGHGVADPADQTLTITDDDDAPSGAITLTVSPTSVAEADSSTTATVTATLPGSTTRNAATDITVSVGGTADAATEGTDYETVADFTLTIAAGAASGTAQFSIDPTQDTIDEGAGETLSISGATTVSGLSVTGTQMTITDDDAPTVTLQLSESSISENGGESTVTASLSEISSETVTVTVTAVPVDPAVNSDFTLSQNKTLTIAAGETASTGTVTITSVDNNVAAPFKMVTVSGAASGGEGAADPASQTLVITNDDVAPSGAITLTVSPTSVAEADGATTATVTATLPGSTTRSVDTAITVSVGDSADAATEGTDYGTVDDFTLTIAAGASSGTAEFSIDPTQDTIDEGASETLSISGSTTVPGLSVTGTQMTIADDDAAPSGAIVLSVSPTSAAESDDATTVTVTATLPGSTTRSVDTAITVSVGDSADAATEGTDYATVADLTLTIAAGATSGTAVFNIDPTQDAIDEGAGETLSISGTTAVSGLSVTGTQMTITDDDATPTLTLKLSKSTITESGGVSTVTAELSGASSETVTVTVSAAPVSPAVSSDYTLSANKTLTIAAGATASTGTVIINAVDNEDDADDKQVTVSGTASGGHGAADPANQTLTIADDDGAVALSVSPTSVAEADNATAATVTATLPGAARSAATTVTVKVGDSADAATEGTDYATVADLTLTIAAGAASGTAEFSMDPTQDTIDEGTGETLSISGTTTASGLSVTGTQMTITDDDATPTLTLKLSKSTITESGGVSTVTAELSGASSEAVTVTVSAAPVSPAVSGDYTVSANKTLIIAAGATASTGTVTITAVDNNTDAADKQVTVSGTASGGRGAADPADQTLTIADDDGAVALKVSPTSVAEADDASTATVTATLPGAARSAATTVTVKVGDSADAATEGTDYATVADLTLTIAAGQTSGTAEFSMDPTQDTIDEGTGETLSISGTTTASGLSVTGTQMTITDDDATPTVTLALSPASISENGGVSTVTATLSGASSAAVTVTVSASAVSPATSSDFNLSTNKTLTIAAGATTSTGTVTITAVNNSVDAPDKTVTVSGSASGGHGAENPANQTLTITDDDATPTLTLKLSKSTITESGGVSTVTAELSGASSEAVTVTVSAAPVSPAVSGDYTVSGNKTLTIAAGATASTGTVTITAVDNEDDAADKQVTVSGTASGGRGAADPANQTLTIADDDGAIALKVTPASVAEADDASTATVTATLPGAARSAATTVTVKVGDSADAATEGTDYATVADLTLTIAAGATSGTAEFSMDPTQDTIDEGTGETLSISGTTTASGLSVTGTQMTITDDDATPTVTLALSPASISENGGESTVTATLSGASSAAVTVTVSASAVSPATSSDFNLSTNKTLTIAAGATTSTGTVTITAVNNSVDAPDKTVTVSGSASGGHGAANPANQTLTITDDDATPTLTLKLSKSTITESGGVSTVTAELSGASSEAVTVTVSAAPVSPAVSGDYTVSGNKTLTIAAGATASTGTVTITAVDNITDAADKQVTVSGTASGGRGAANPANQTLTIADDDGAIALKVTPASVDESDEASTATVTATLPGAARSAATTVTVKVGDSADAATEGTDYATVADLTLTIAAGATSGTAEFSMDPTQDTIDEGTGETLSISGTTTASGLSVTGTQMTINDDDATPTVTLALSPASISENGGESTVTATLSGASSAAVTVTVSASAVSPATSSDFNLSTNKTLTIAAGATASTGTVTITAVNNSVDAPDKTVTVSGSASGGHGAANPANQTLTITDDDGTPTLTLKLSKSTITESGGVSTVTAELSGASSEAVTVTVSAAPVSPAVSGDYTVSGNKTLTIAAGATASTGTVTITAVDNDARMRRTSR